MTDKQLSLDEMQADIEDVFSVYTKDMIKCNKQFYDGLEGLQKKYPEQEASKNSVFNAIVNERYKQHEQELNDYLQSIS